MDFNEYYQKAKDKITSMEHKELVKWATNMARQIEQQNWSVFLNSFDAIEDEYVETERYTEVEKQDLFDEALNICDDINEGIFMITAVYDDEYNYGYHYGDSCRYTDEDGIGDQLDYVLNIAQSFFDLKRYDTAHKIYSALCALEIAVYDESMEETDYWDINTFAGEKLLLTNMNDIAPNILYAVYMVTEPEKLEAIFYDHYAWKLHDNMKLEDIYGAGPEPLPDFNYFIDRWIDLLKEKTGKRAAALLMDAVIYRDGKQGIACIAKEFPVRFPLFYVEWFKQLLENGCYKQILQESDTALNAMDKDTSLRYKVASISYMSCKAEGNPSDLLRYAYAVFESNPGAKNYLRLSVLPGSQEWCDHAIVRAQQVFNNMNNKTNYYNEDEWGTVAIYEMNLYALWFFHKDFDYAINLCESKQKSEWSCNFEDAAIPLFLLLVTGKIHRDKFAEKIIGDIASNLNYQIENDDKEFIEYFDAWLKDVHLTEDQNRRYYQWVKTTVNDRIIDIVGNQVRSSYYKAAKMAILLGKAEKAMGEAISDQEAVNRYKMMFPRHISFRKEFTAFGY